MCSHFGYNVYMYGVKTVSNGRNTSKLGIENGKNAPSRNSHQTLFFGWHHFYTHELDLCKLHKNGILSWCACSTFDTVFFFGIIHITKGNNIWINRFSVIKPFLAGFPIPIHASIDFLIWHLRYWCHSYE